MPFYRQSSAKVLCTLYKEVTPTGQLNMYVCKYIYIERETEKDRERQRETEREADRQTDKERETKREREIEREICRYVDI